MQTEKYCQQRYIHPGSVLPHTNLLKLYATNAATDCSFLVVGRGQTLFINRSFMHRSSNYDDMCHRAQYAATLTPLTAYLHTLHKTNPNPIILIV